MKSYGDYPQPTLASIGGTGGGRSIHATVAPKGLNEVQQPSLEVIVEHYGGHLECLEDALHRLKLLAARMGGAVPETSGNDNPVGAGYVGDLIFRNARLRALIVEVQEPIDRLESMA